MTPRDEAKMHMLIATARLRALNGTTITAHPSVTKAIGDLAAVCVELGAAVRSLIDDE